MQRYLAPTWIYLAAILLVGVDAWFPIDDRVASSLLIAALGLYVVASLRWVQVAVTAPPPLRLHHVLVWIPAILPILLIVLSVRAMRTTDAAAMLVMGLLPVIGGGLLLPFFGAVILALRRPERQSEDSA